MHENMKRAKLALTFELVFGRVVDALLCLAAFWGGKVVPRFWKLAGHRRQLIQTPASGNKVRRLAIGAVQVGRLKMKTKQIFIDSTLGICFAFDRICFCVPYIC